MDRLSRRDLGSALDFIARIGATTDLDAFAAELVRGSFTLIDADVASYNEFNRKRRRLNWIVEPAAVDFPDSRRIFNQHLNQHPVLAYRRRTGDGKAVKISDFLDVGEWRRRPLYNEFFRRIRLTHMLGILLPQQGAVLIEWALLRADRDFTERERAILELVRPHLATAYRNAALRTDHQRQLALLYRGIDASGFAAISLTRDGRVHSMTERARAWLSEYFPTTKSGQLPENLIGWTRQHETLKANDDEPPLASSPCIVARAGKRLIVHQLRQDGCRVLLMEEEREALRPEELLSLGLTRREAEALAWVAAGKTDAETAAILDISPRTVSHTLERVYRKLGVETRGGATSRALRAARGNPQSLRRP